MGLALGVMVAGLVSLLGTALVLDAKQKADRFLDLSLAPVDPIRRVRDGDVAKLVVRLVARADLESPLARTPCIAWGLWVEEQTPDGWRPVLAETRVGPMRGDGAEGIAVAVEADPAHTLVAFDDPGEWRGPSPGVLARIAEKRATKVEARELRAREVVLVAGDAVAVLGRAAWRGAAAGYRETPRELVLGGDAAHPVLVSARAEHRR